jgi:hypothetical protein
MRYGVAPVRLPWWQAAPLIAVGVALALVATTPLTPVLGQQAPYLFYVAAVFVSGILGGLGPGLLATM